MQSKLEEYAKKLSDNDMRLVSLFMIDNNHTHDRSDFLSSELGISDVFASSNHDSREGAIEARGPVDGQCEGHGKIEVDLSAFQIKMVCGSIIQAAAGGGSTFLEAIESKICTEKWKIQFRACK